MPAPVEKVESAADDAALTERVRALGLSSGLQAVGVTSADVLEPARTVIPARKEAGLAGVMQFTYRNPERSTDPRRALPTARSIVCGALGYRRQAPAAPSDASGRVARYAWRDHYDDLRSILTSIANLLEQEGWTARVHLDDNNLVDRNVAQRAGLGWYGKNANLLLPGQGSWFVLGSVLTDAPLVPADQPVDDGCGSCRRCIDDCPTDAIVAPGIVDATRCIAWLVQGPGPIPIEFREAVGDRLYGCDDCQEVCPPNRGAEAEPAPVAEPDTDAFVELAWVLTASDDELMERLGRWYIAGRDPNVIRRTALVALGNSADPADPTTIELLERHLASASSLLRSHAVWAARRLGRTDLADGLREDEQSSDVLVELGAEVVSREVVGR